MLEGGLFLPRRPPASSRVRALGGSSRRGSSFLAPFSSASAYVCSTIRLFLVDRHAPVGLGGTGGAAGRRPGRRSSAPCSPTRSEWEHFLALDIRLGIRGKMPSCGAIFWLELTNFVLCTSARPRCRRDGGETSLASAYSAQSVAEEVARVGAPSGVGAVHVSLHEPESCSRPIVGFVDGTGSENVGPVERAGGRLDHWL